MLDQLLLGTIQGITEWLPISSEAMIILVKVNLLGSQESLTSLIDEALFLHLGTALAAILYFRHEVFNILQTATAPSYWAKLARAPKRLFNKNETTYGEMDAHERTVTFMILTTLISGLLGIALVNGISWVADAFGMYSKALNGLIGISLIATGILITRTKQIGHKKSPDINLADTIALGVVQGFSVLPGLSRSGLTVATLLFKRYDKTTALRLSFMMSIPLVIGGNILTNFNRFTFSEHSLWGLAASFTFGLLTIHILLRIAQRTQFGLFVIGFGILTLLAALLL